MELYQFNSDKEYIANVIGGSKERIRSLDTIEQVYAHLTLLKIYIEKIQNRIDREGKLR